MKWGKQKGRNVLDQSQTYDKSRTLRKRDKGGGKKIKENVESGRKSSKKNPARKIAPVIILRKREKTVKTGPKDKEMCRTDHQSAWLSRKRRRMGVNLIRRHASTKQKPWAKIRGDEKGGFDSRK